MSRNQVQKVRLTWMIIILIYLSSAVSGQAINLPVWDNDTPIPHLVFGTPSYVDHDPNHHILQKYEAFSVNYDDQVLSPRWTAIKLTHHIADENADIDREAKFKADSELKQKGYRVSSHNDYKNPTGLRLWDRGHMVQFDDARGYGENAAKESFYTSNVCPQLSKLNQKGWLKLEQTCTEFARDYKAAWIYTGPIYGEYKVPFALNRRVPRPIAFFKIVVAPGEDDPIDVLAFRVPHEPMSNDVELSDYLVSIRDVENETGLDFLHELPDDFENLIETSVWEIWPDLE